MNEITTTVSGNVVSDVTLRFTQGGDAVASFRVASTTRRMDRSSGQWIDAETTYLTVTCWRHTATNVAKSLQRGMPVVVHGRMRQRRVDKQIGGESVTFTYTDLEATSLGPDLTRGVATFERVRRGPVVESESRALGDALGAHSAGIVDSLPEDVGHPRPPAELVPEPIEDVPAERPAA